MTTEMNVQTIPMKKIKLGRNSRLDMRDADIESLMASIKQQGLLQPVGVSRQGTGYELCYGNRRFLACSKLGWKKIPVVMHESTDQADDDLRNLSENIQRRNISLQEVGRYLEILQKQDLTIPQIAIRLGLSQKYLETCSSAFRAIPREFHSSIEVRRTNDKRRTAGKVSLSTAQQITRASSTYGLTAKEVKKLFKAAQTDERFMKENVGDYATALKSGARDPIGSKARMTNAYVRFFIDTEEKKELEERFVTNGPFSSFNTLMIAVLKGEKSLRLPNIRA